MDASLMPASYKPHMQSVQSSANHAQIPISPTQSHIQSVQPPISLTQSTSLLNLLDKRVYLACGKTDMRKSINGLAAIVEGSFNLDLFSGALFVFCNGNRNRLKILVWDGDGFWLLFKRLEKGRFRWPAPSEKATMILSGEELSILLGGARVELKLKRNEVFERRIS